MDLQWVKHWCWNKYISAHRWPSPCSGELCCDLQSDQNAVPLSHALISLLSLKRSNYEATTRAETFTKSSWSRFRTFHRSLIIYEVCLKWNRDCRENWSLRGKRLKLARLHPLRARASYRPVGLALWDSWGELIPKSLGENVTVRKSSKADRLLKQLYRT
jgi:hypothetical protein